MLTEKRIYNTDNNLCIILTLMVFIVGSYIDIFLLISAVTTKVPKELKVIDHLVGPYQKYYYPNHTYYSQIPLSAKNVININSIISSRVPFKNNNTHGYCLCPTLGLAAWPTVKNILPDDYVKPKYPLLLYLWILGHKDRSVTAISMLLYLIVTDKISNVVHNKYEINKMVFKPSEVIKAFNPLYPCSSNASSDDCFIKRGGAGVIMDFGDCYLRVDNYTKCRDEFPVCPNSTSLCTSSEQFTHVPFDQSQCSWNNYSSIAQFISVCNFMKGNQDLNISSLDKVVKQPYPWTASIDYGSSITHFMYLLIGLFAANLIFCF